MKKKFYIELLEEEVARLREANELLTYKLSEALKSPEEKERDKHFSALMRKTESLMFNGLEGISAEPSET